MARRSNWHVMRKWMFVLPQHRNPWRTTPKEKMLKWRRLENVSDQDDWVDEALGSVLHLSASEGPTRCSVPRATASFSNICIALLEVQTAIRSGNFMSRIHDGEFVAYVKGAGKTASASQPWIRIIDLCHSRKQFELRSTVRQNSVLKAM